MEQEELERVRDLIADPKWRLDNLYHVVDETGKDVTFRMRPAQERLYDDLWYYNIVLKARQLGFTTFIDLICLDMAVTVPNMTCRIIAETKDKAADIFNSKIMYPYESLPAQLREWCPVARCSKDGEVVFRNGSSIKVSVSARSGTCQFLHISEYGPICAMQPAKAREIKTGSLPAVHSGGFCFVESTAMGNSGDFHDMVQRALAARASGRRLDRQEFRLHFFPWHSNAEYRADPTLTAVPARLLEYFDGLYDGHGIELDEEQQAWYAMQERIYGDAVWSEYPSYPEEAFKVANEGSYYARQFMRIHRESRICAVPWDEDLPVHTSWDLGMSDETCVWFFQFVGKEVRVIDYYENAGEGLPHYAAVLRERGYRYGRHFAPHDIAVRELSSGTSRQEAAKALGIEFERVMTNRDLMGGIDSVRDMLDYCWFDESRTERGLKCLEAYRKEWDDQHGCYKSQPLHDWASHGADAFRTMAVAWRLGLVSGLPKASGTMVVKGGLRRI
jgi:hypothetical protein